jgi:hypothetical protein
MEGLIELVAASFARHGIECPIADSVRGPEPSRACPEPSRRVQVERSSLGADSHSNSEFAVAQSARHAEPAFTASLPEHNYRRSLQSDPAP